MRYSLLILAALGAGLLPQAAHADPYRFCADYSGGRGGGTNCYFMNYQQCRAAIQGMGGFCRPNPFYDGRPIRTPEEGGMRSR